MELINHTTDMWIFSRQVFSLHVYALPISWDALHHLHWIERRRWGPCNEKKFSLLWVMSLIMVSTQCEFDFNYCLIVLKIPKNTELAIFSSGQNKQGWLDFRKSSDICIWTSSPGSCDIEITPSMWATGSAPGSTINLKLLLYILPPWSWNCKRITRYSCWGEVGGVQVRGFNLWWGFSWRHCHGLDSQKPHTKTGLDMRTLVVGNGKLMENHRLNFQYLSVILYSTCYQTDRLCPLYFCVG